MKHVFRDSPIAEFASPPRVNPCTHTFAMHIVMFDHSLFVDNLEFNGLALEVVYISLSARFGNLVLLDNPFFDDK
jgi:hypothetical protein